MLYIETFLFLSGIQLKKEKKAKLTQLLKIKEDAERIRNENEELKKTAEDSEKVALEEYRKLEEEEKKRNAEEQEKKSRAEAKETFDKFDSNQDGLLDISELQSRKMFDKDGDSMGNYFIYFIFIVRLQTVIINYIPSP